MNTIFAGAAGGLQFKNDAQRVWLQKMAERGWTVPEWPKQYGGGGLSKDEARVLREEMAALKCRPPLTSFGISMLGPALLKYGNEKQKSEHIPKIVRGEIRWCQGYSEPGAGSDLASLKTRADDHGDHFVVNGSKIWTSYGDKADWIFCLVRTSFAGKKQEGISFVLFDMESAGVDDQPDPSDLGLFAVYPNVLRQREGAEENLLGELNKGWTIAKYLLTHERNMIGGMGTQRVTPLSSACDQEYRSRGGPPRRACVAYRYRALRDGCAGIRAHHEPRYRSKRRRATRPARCRRCSSTTAPSSTSAAPS